MMRFLNITCFFFFFFYSRWVWGGRKSDVQAIWQLETCKQLEISPDRPVQAAHCLSSVLLLCLFALVQLTDPLWVVSMYNTPLKTGALWPRPSANLEGHFLTSQAWFCSRFTRRLFSISSGNDTNTLWQTLGNPATYYTAHHLSEPLMSGDKLEILRISII